MGSPNQKRDKRGRFAAVQAMTDEAKRALKKRAVAELKTRVTAAEVKLKQHLAAEVQAVTDVARAKFDQETERLKERVRELKDKLRSERQ